MKLYGHPNSTRNRKPRMAAHHAGVEIEEILINVLEGGGQSPDFLTINPFGRIPALVDGDLRVTESEAISSYLALKAGKPELLGGNDPAQRAQVEAWRYWATSHFDPATAALGFEILLKPLLMKSSPDEARVETERAKFSKEATILDRHLDGRQWVAGDTCTLADFSIACALGYHEETQLDLERFPQILRWLGGVSELPSWTATLPPKLG